MIGNDIVDVKLAGIESNWRRKGYLDKIFTAEEQLLITSSKKPNIMVWLLWSMKESAYKINNRATGVRTFAPFGLVCKDLHIRETKATGIVLINTNKYFTISNINKKFIHTIAADDRHALQKVTHNILINEPSEDYSYKDTNPGSVSHHGQYLALAYPPELL